MKNHYLLLLAAVILVASSGFSQISEQKLTATSISSAARLGEAVAIAGDRAVFGALEDFNRGAAFIFERDGSGSWKQVQKLVASDGSNGDGFGVSVAISGDRILVGAHLKSDLGSATGAAYLFERQGNGSWLEVAKLTASDKSSETFYGESVALEGDLAVVGAAGAGIHAERLGAAYIYQRQAGGDWAEVAKVTASDGTPITGFGSSVSISGNYLLVGANLDQQAADNGGAAYIFEKQADNSWEEKNKLTASDAQDFDAFGSKVSLSGERALVGGFAAGSAYVFERQQGGSWTETAILKSNSTHASMFFGRSVAILGDRALVADLGDAMLPANLVGTGLLFERQQDGTWKKTIEVAGTGNGFGASVALSEQYALVGAVEEGCCGAVYAYELELATDVEFAQYQQSPFALAAPYPNPFREQATVSFYLPAATPVRLAMYNTLGQPVRLLKEGAVPAGQHQLEINGLGLAEGIYILSLETPAGKASKKVMVMD